MSADVPPPSMPPQMPPPAVACCPRSIALMSGLLVLVVMSVLLTTVGLGKMHLHITWEAKTMHEHKLTDLVSAALLQPSMQTEVQPILYSQGAASRSIGSASSRASSRSVVSAPLILTRLSSVTELSLPLPQAMTTRPRQRQQTSIVAGVWVCECVCVRVYVCVCVCVRVCVCMCVCVRD